METGDKKEVLALVNKAHSLVEQMYLQNPAAKDSPEWLNKRRLLLADLALHLVQAAVAGDEMHSDLLKRYLYSILTIAQDYLPEINLSSTAERLLSDEPVPATPMPI